MSRRPPSQRKKSPRSQARSPVATPGLDAPEAVPRRRRRRAQTAGASQPPRTSRKKEDALPEAPAPEMGPLDSTENAFFAHADETSVPPAALDLHEPDMAPREPRRPMTPELAARRARLRRVVAGIVGAAAFMSTLVAARFLMGPRRPALAADTAVNVPYRILPSIELPAAAAADPATESAAPATAPEPPPVREPSPAPAASEAVAPSPPLQPERDAVGAATNPETEPDLATEKKTARAMIQRGKLKEGIAAAEQAIEHAPEDAEIYLLLGAALQDSGRWMEASSVFARCTREAKKGPVGDCRALARR